ncbi:major facilitator superfamily domain-containing protein [Myxozyma melibiosi]|uniref:Major facilitator superfamily domain-containing protein n=1 Tax=Myxozyma melibiosi TaxID=54550 RepID=A0ABR1F1U8_9ASCO
MADIEKGSSSSDPSASDDLTDLAPVISPELRKEYEDAGVPLSVSPSQPEDPEDPVLLERVRTAMSIASETVGTPKALEQTKSGKPLPAFGGGKPYPPLVGNREAYVVEFDGPDDPTHPQNFPFLKKAKIMSVLGFSTFTAAWGSSIFSSATAEIAEKFHVSNVVALLGMSLYVLGFASGPLVWAPFSELSGRRKPIIVGMLGFSIFNLAVARAYDLQTVLICRFFAGFFGASCLTVVPAAFSDIFGNRWRGTAMVIFSAAVFCGPLMAPVVGGFIAASYLKWRWTEYLTMIMGWASFIIIVLFIDETYAPAVLIEKASLIRRATGNWSIHARQEQVELNFRELIEKNFTRPVRMLYSEPILLLITIYTAFVYGILYLLLECYPIIFIEGYGMSSTVGMLPYMGMIVGQLLGCGVVLLFEPRVLRAIAANGNRPVPEARLEPTMIGGFLFPIGMFWLTWCGAYHEHVHWMAPTAAGVFIGSGIILIFLTCITYLVESYLMFAASAVAANTVLRSGFGAGFPLFATAMFHNLGTQWAGTLLGCLGLLLAPVPILFYKYGKRLRKASKYAPNI